MGNYHHCDHNYNPGVHKLHPRHVYNGGLQHLRVQLQRPVRLQHPHLLGSTRTTTTTTTAAPSTCTVSSGPAAGQSCVFPFTYGGTTFSGCAEWVYGGEHQCKLWCSTKVDSTGTHVNGEGNYGFCSSTCTAVSLFDLIGNLLGDGSTSTAQRRGSGSVVFGSSSSSSSTSSRVRARRPF